MPDAAQKSGIGCVILPGSSNFSFVQGATSSRTGWRGRNRVVLARAARDFLKDFGFLALKFHKIFWPAGPPSGSLADS